MVKSAEYSNLKIFYHTDRIKGVLENQRVAPVYIRIKPTNTCNQNCFYCGYANDKVFKERSVKKVDFIPWEKMNQIIDDISDMGVKAVTFSGGGDPLCYKFIVPTIKKIKEKNIDFSVITNGQALNGEIARELSNANWVRISLDSANSATYKSIRKVDTYNQVLQNIKDFITIKAEKCTVGINCVITKDNFNQIYELCKIVAGIGADNIKFSPIMLKEGMYEYHNEIKQEVKIQIKKAIESLENDKFKIIDKYDEDISLEKDFKKEYCKCYMNRMFTVIAADSKVYYCHQRAYTKSGKIGDLTNQAFKDLWFSDETSKKLDEMNAQKECNFRCAFEERNILMNNLIGIDKNHVNFI